MIINREESGSHTYILQIQYGAIGFTGTWFSNSSHYETAYEQFLRTIEKDRAISILTENNIGLFIHIGPGMIIMFMTREMHQEMQEKNKSKLLVAH